MLYHLLRERERDREWEENWIHHFSGRLVSGFSFSREKREREDTWLPPTHDLVGEQREKFAFVPEQISISERVSTLRSLPRSRHMTSCLIPPTATAIPLYICCGSEFKVEPRDAMLWIPNLSTYTNKNRFYINHQSQASYLEFSKIQKQ